MFYSILLGLLRCTSTDVFTGYQGYLRCDGGVWAQDCRYDGCGVCASSDGEDVVWVW